MKLKLKLLIVVLAAQCGWLVSICAVQELGLHGGKIILLETEPVDPRDMLRGDYLILNYKISTMPRSLFTPPVKKTFPPGTAIFVAVAPVGANGFYSAIRASTSRFEPSGDEILLRGKARENWWNDTNTIRVDYGLERFYVAEGTGNPPNGTKLTVQASVSSSGRAIIKQVLANGQPYTQWVGKTPLTKTRRRRDAENMIFGFCSPALSIILLIAHAVRNGGLLRKL